MIPTVPKALTLSGLVAIFAAGLLLAGTLPVGGGAADATTTDTTTSAETTTAVTTETTTTTEPSITAPETSTETTTTTLPGTTVTIETTTTKIVQLPTPTPGTTTEETPTSSSGNGTEAWVWVLLGILAAGLIALIVLLARRGGGSSSGGGGGLSPEDRLRRLDGAVASWAAQGWAVETQTAESAVLRRGEEAMLVTVDAGGHVSTKPLVEPQQPPPSGDWPGASGNP
jgi:hypothetical protein